MPCADREGHQQKPDRQHQPGLVGVPERADRGDHAVLFGVVGEGEQDADAKVEAVEHDVDQDRQAHQGGEGQGQPDGGIAEEVASRYSAATAATTGRACPDAAGPCRLALGGLAREVEERRRYRRQAAPHRPRGRRSACPAPSARAHRPPPPLVVSTPCTSQGWRPISVVYQPASVAIQPEKAMADEGRRASASAAPATPRLRRAHQERRALQLSEQHHHAGADHHAEGPEHRRHGRVQHLAVFGHEVVQARHHAVAAGASG